MVIDIQRVCRISAALALLGVLCQCTTREVKSTRTKFSFAGDGDRKELRSKFAEKGYTIAEDGTIKADKPDLFAGEEPRGLDGAFRTKEAKFRKSKMQTKEFPTPEFIKRQEFRGVREARESGSLAREGDFDRAADREGGRLFRTRSDSTTELASYDTGSYREAGREFSAGEDRRASASYQSAPVAEGLEQQGGYRENAALTMDDVKKMVSPAVYGRAMKIED